MLDSISRIKRHLSHIREDRWHYKAFSLVWQKKSEGWIKKKACTYYWFYLPTSFLVIGILCAITAAVWAGGIFFGYRPKFKGGEDAPGSELFYPHKEWKNGKKIPFSPFEAIFAISLTCFAIWLPFWLIEGARQHMHSLKIAGAVGLVLFALGVFCYFFLKGWNASFIKHARGIARISLAKWWDKACPTLIVEKSEAAKADAS